MFRKEILTNLNDTRPVSCIGYSECEKARVLMAEFPKQRPNHSRMFRPCVTEAV